MRTSFVFCGLAALLLVPTGCRSVARSAGPQPWPFAGVESVADSVSTEVLTADVRLHRLVQVTAPWRAVVLDIRLSACTRAQALKGAPTGVGRLTTSSLLAGMPVELRGIAAVNADFFLFAPPGVPTNAHVEVGTMLTGPGPYPVLSFDDQRGVFIDTLRAVGTVSTSRVRLSLSHWNRPSPRQAGVVDGRWGVPLDTTVRRSAWRLDPLPTLKSSAEGSAYVARALRAGDSVVTADTLLLVATPAQRQGLQLGDTVRVARTLLPRMPWNAVGGRGILLADSAITRDVDTEGSESFRGLNPRTAAGVAVVGGQTRLLLAVIDGRQAGYSMGMTLRQTADLLRALGAQRAINLDGGGSSAMVLRDERTGATRVVNRPSDATGERPVGNALAIRTVCREP